MRTPESESDKPARMERIRGFRANLPQILLIDSRLVPSSRLRSSRIAIEIGTLTIAIVLADKVARLSAAGKANTTNGIPKKAVLPKIVAITSKENVSLE